MSSDAVLYLLPESVLIVAATLLYIGGAFRPRSAWTAYGAVALAVAAGALTWQYRQWFWDAAADSPRLAVEVAGPLWADLLGQYARWLALAVGLFLVWISSSADDEEHGAETIGTILMAVAGVMLVASARNLVLMFVGLELLSIPTYVLLATARRDAQGQEATIKYFFLSILASGLLLYGFSFLYGIGGSLDLGKIRVALSQPVEELGGARLLGRVALVLIFAGLGFRVTAVPFHFYAPDVYQGTTHQNASLLAVLPKVAGFVALIRIVAVAMPGMESFGWRVALILSILTMTLGNALALWQNHLRRLLAYSSIANAGYMLMGVAALLAQPVGTESVTNGAAAVMLYLGLYAFGVTGIFACFVGLSSGKRKIEHIDDLAGLGSTNPRTALALTLFLFSLAGIPPLAGFWGKFGLFAGALDVDAGAAELSGTRLWFIVLAVIAGLNAAVAAAYYLRLIAVMYFGDVREAATVVMRRGPAWTAGICAGLVILLGVLPAPLARMTGAAGRSIFAVAPGEQESPRAQTAWEAPVVGPSARAGVVARAD